MAEKNMIEIHAFKMVCPICERPLSISVPENGMRPWDWSPNVLGVADCRGCQRDFLVTLPRELEKSLKELANRYVLGFPARSFLDILFR